jgi:hypothetical protein
MTLQTFDPSVNLIHLARRTSKAITRAREHAEKHPTKENWDAWHMLVDAEANLRTAGVLLNGRI